MLGKLRDTENDKWKEKRLTWRDREKEEKKRKRWRKYIIERDRGERDGNKEIRERGEEKEIEKKRKIRRIEIGEKEDRKRKSGCNVQCIWAEIHGRNLHKCVSFQLPLIFLSDRICLMSSWNCCSGIQIPENSIRVEHWVIWGNAVLFLCCWCYCWCYWS